MHDISPEKRRRALLQAFFVTILWSSSWVFIKIGLHDIRPLMFAGLRYFAAFLLLLATMTRVEFQSLWRLDGFRRGQILGLGFTLYFLTQGAQFVSLTYFPAALPAMVIQLTPIAILFLSWPVLGERPRMLQIAGVAICIAGGFTYLLSQYQQNLQPNWHLAVPGCGLAANVVAALLGRSINRSGQLTAKAVTVGSMGFGSVLLLISGMTLEPWPALGLKQTAILVWLVVVNTSLAFTWWNQSLQTLSSVESSVINNSMMIQVAIFAWIFLGEALTGREVAALALAFAGILIVQLRSRPGKANPGER